MSLSKPASHRVLFNEDYLDMIFPYLSTTDLKNARLTTPFWNKTATKFLGRKSFEPIRFSDLTFEDWMTLKREIEAARPEEDPRIKLFQGFRLTWVEVATAAYCSFMTPFKPSQIIVGGRDISPGSSLTILLTPILSTLSHLTLEIYWDVLIIEFHLPILGELANLQGMRLKRLHLQLWKNNEDLVYRRRGCVFLSNLLASQAPTLDELHLNLESNVKNEDDKDSRIQFPIFHRLTSLVIKMTQISPEDPLVNFAPFNFVQKFPNLLSLDINDKFLCEMSGEFNDELGEDNIFELTKGHSLKKIRIDYTDLEEDEHEIPIEFFTKLEISFPKVEEFMAQSLGVDGSVFPWVNTLKKIKISEIFFSPFNLVHLKNLKTLKYTSKAYEEIEDTNEFIDMLLEHYGGLPLLKKFHISRFKSAAQQRIQIRDALPHQFLDILTIVY